MPEPRPAYSCPRVIHGSEESPEGLLPAASVNNSAENFELALRARTLSREGEHATPGYEFTGLTLDVLL
jgi:hypothetical protein